MKPKAVESNAKNKSPNQKLPSASTEKQEAKGKETKMTQQQQAKNQKEPKGKIEEEQIEEVVPPPEKEKNLERFIYVTVYNDSDHMRKLKELFEEINQEAFQLKSVKEIYTRGLSNEERDDNEKDYISGCQLIDKDRRITLIEGVTGKAMVKVKEKLPKTQMNNAHYKVFADSKALFNKRIYSKFDLSLKYIKLRDPLNVILTTYDIYAKANKMREVYNAFLSFGAILKAKTMLELYNGSIFPNADSLLLLERKYADILTEEDLTGIHTVKKPKRKIKNESMDKSSIYSTTSQSVDLQLNQKNKQSALDKEKESNDQKDKEKSKNKPSLDSHNLIYEEYLKKSHLRKTWEDTLKGNFDYLKTMNRKPPQGHFCKPMELSFDSNEEVNLYSTAKNNYYEKYLNIMRERYAKDKDNYYTYSKHSLALSFPMLPNRNQDYLEYIDNKTKWINKKDFNIHEQPKREYIFFPRLNNVL